MAKPVFTHASIVCDIAGIGELGLNRRLSHVRITTHLHFAIAHCAEPPTFENLYGCTASPFYLSFLHFPFFSTSSISPVPGHN